jgi:Winged helix DNA-binding domain
MAADPVTMVRQFGAVQAQDYGGAKWALALRTTGATDASLDAAFDRGELLRTHVLRPTWHFVAPDDIRWLLALTGARLLATSRVQYTRMELTTSVLSRACTVLQRSMEGGRALDRDQIRRVLARARIDAGDSLRFACIMMFAECQALVTSGPRRGKHFTYALLDGRAPATGVPRTRDDAVCALVQRYFTTRAPATVHDFAVWSGLTVTDARAGLEANRHAFVSEDVEGVRWYAPAETPASAPRGPLARLLPNYDEFVIGYRDRSPLTLRLRAERAALGDRDMLSNVLAIDGQVVGRWRRTARRRALTISLTPSVRCTNSERAALEREVARLGRFADVAAEPAWEG